VYHEAVSNRSTHYEKKKETLYGDVAAKLELQILSGVYAQGEKLPSLRELSQRLGVSVNTVREAYGNLESRGIILGVPQSGFYAQAPAESRVYTLEKPCRVEDELLADYNGFMSKCLDPGCNPLSCAVFDLSELPYSRELYLSREEQRQMNLFSYPQPEGLYGLRVEIARRSLDAGITVSPEEVLITEGGMSALSLAVQVLTSPGDTVALESPFYFNFLHLIREYGLNVIEIPMDERKGMNLDVLEYVLSRHRVKAVITVPNYQNPLGNVMPDGNKKRLVEMLREREILLLEDDIYGDLGFQEQRPPACRAFDSRGNVVLCSSFSKSLAPGLRLGWMLPGRWREKFLALKTMTSVAVSLPAQHMALRFLTGGHYDRHMRLLRKRAFEKMEALKAAVRAFFPPGVQMTEPRGGFVLWITLPLHPGSGDPEPPAEGQPGTQPGEPGRTASRSVTKGRVRDIRRIYELAGEEGIYFAPGSLFSLEGRWNHCLRLSAGHYTPALEPSVRRLGEIIARHWDFPAENP